MALFVCSCANESVTSKTAANSTVLTVQKTDLAVSTASAAPPIPAAVKALTIDPSLDGAVPKERRAERQPARVDPPTRTQPEIALNGSSHEAPTTPKSEAQAAPSAPVAVSNKIDKLTAPVELENGPKAVPWKAIVPAALLLIAVLAIALGYLGSGSMRSRRKLREIVAQFDALLNAHKGLASSVRNATSAAAHEYIDVVRQSYLAAISLDEVRKLAPGVRLQPLYSSGVTNLLHCRGWTTARFQQLRGIGPDSAYKIGAACDALTKGVNRMPIRRPSRAERSGSAKRLYLGLFRDKKVGELLHGQESALDSILKMLRTQSISIDSRTSFLAWMFGSESKGPLKQAIEEANSIASRMSPEHDLGKALAGGSACLNQAQGAVRQGVSHEDLIADIESDESFYRDSLRNLLGPEEAATMSDGPARLPGVQPAIEPVRVRPSANVTVGYSLNRAPGFRIEVNIGDTQSSAKSTGMAQNAANCWVPAGQVSKVGTHTIKGGLIYVGRNLRSANGQTIEPALIDPTMAIQDATADCHVRSLNYWSNYSYASPEARAAYLQWLEQGRNDPAADVGYAFLYFYGLERRALIDAIADQKARDEIPAIIEEVRRLRSIYSASGSFRKYSTEFLEYLDATRATEAAKNESEELPALERYRLSFELRRKLGGFAANAKPLPAAWAYTWFHNDPRTRLPSAALRCPDQVNALFAAEYGRRFGEGIVLPANKTKLKLSYRPASASFGSPFAKTIDLPDVCVLSTTYEKIAVVATDCFQQLDGYSRYVARNKDQADSLDAFVLLPSPLWPESVKNDVVALKQKLEVQGAANVIKFRELLKYLPTGPTPTRAKYTALCQALEGVGIGIEPDVRFGGSQPNPDDPIAIFASDGPEKVRDGFGVAALMLQLASVVASADGNFSDPEAQALRDEIGGNARLAPSEKRRLVARMATYRVKAASLTGLKKTIDAMDATTRSGLVDFLVTMVQADGVIAPSEVKAMEKIYALFELDAASLYTRLHALAAISDPQTPSDTRGREGIHLDKAKVERLKAASAEVTKKLSVIFASEEDQPVIADEPETSVVANEVDAPPTLLGLDAIHAGLLTVLLGRPQWTRAEFEELCSDKGLMPDGALENINEAAFGKFDQPLVEGEDPLEIALQLLEEKAA